ncbi:MAG: hypothetical protein PHD61_05780 [Bacteroidales bacterium]|nr:hypothetical protein [Lentimicrobiaceae bacterium]MDD5694796.1 hypothetical protein [Bacteroidales bacterium]
MKYLPLLLLLLVHGCKSGLFQTGEDQMIARVYNAYLYRSDLEGIVPTGTHPEDSTMIVKNFINKWIEEQLLIQAAEEALSSDQKNFKDQLENYRNSLLIYTYESYLIRQYMDTVVRDEEISRYYEENKQNFELKENIVRAHFVILKEAPRKNNPLKRLMLSNDPADLDELTSLCKKNNYDYFIEDEWIPFSELIKIIPIETYNQTIYLQSNKYVELNYGSQYYFIRFLDFKIQESVSPLSLEKENIRNIIINKRKAELIEKMRREMLQQAMNTNGFEIF